MKDSTRNFLGVMILGLLIALAIIATQMQFWEAQAYPAFYCVDRDGGKNYMFKGEVFGNYESFPFSSEDRCESNEVLVEFFCRGDLSDSEVVECRGDSYNRCVDGECVFLQECGDDIDNDGDGLIDLDDPGCQSLTDPDEI